MSYYDSWHDLKDQFEQALRKRSANEEHTWFKIWHIFLTHPWYRSQLRQGAIKAIAEASAPNDWREDVEQEAMILLGRSLRAAPDLHMNARQVEGHFPGWIGTIIHRDCLQAIRRFRAGNSRNVEMQNKDLLVAAHADLDAKIDLSIALDKLSAADRKILMLRAAGMTVKEIAAKIGTSESTTYRMLRRALTRVKRLL